MFYENVIKCTFFMLQLLAQGGDTLIMRRFNYRIYVVLLCTAYFTMLYIFHGNLQVEITTPCQNKRCWVKSERKNPGSQDAKIDETLEVGDEKLELRRIKGLDDHNFSQIKFLNTPKSKVFDSGEKFVSRSMDVRLIVDFQMSKETNFTNQSDKIRLPNPSETCYLDASFPNRQFYSLEPDSFVYSAYYDERYSKHFIRLMTILNLNKTKRKLKVYCHFSSNGTDFKQEASFYELCENHGKPYGGFMLSCEVPREVTDVCSITVSMDIISLSNNYVVPETSKQTLPVTKLGFDFKRNQLSRSINRKYNFSVCIPPLFGNIDTDKLIEFIELNRELGFEHFMFYTAKIDNADVLKVLNYYVVKNIVTVVDFILPSTIQKNKIWYNAQLSAHNDCLYRAMSISNFVAFIDIDEFIVPHDGKYFVTDLIRSEFNVSDNVCGISFDSVFYDSKYSKHLYDLDTSLITQKLTGRTTMFSKVRTKVMVRPEKIFEVGIHHISKPAEEAFKVVKVNSSNVYLHHYRSCVPNYGMKCNNFEEDLTMWKYGGPLKETFAKIQKDVFPPTSESIRHLET